tara:strand:+ start:896 stop:1252 length:357 start_codon:yes stop_codon:yes gene_type:complete
LVLRVFLFLTVHACFHVTTKNSGLFGGIHVTPKKTRNSSGKQQIYQWTTALREAVDCALAVRPVDISPYVFCTKRGASYYNLQKDTSYSWKTKWRRMMDKALKETELKDRFTEHDLRA